MKFRVSVLVISIGIGGSLVTAHAQITDSEVSARWMASQIAAKGGGTSDDYYEYAVRLARTMSQYSPSVQNKIFGFLPIPSSATAETQGNSNGPDNGFATTPEEALNNPALTSGEVFDAIVNKSPLSDHVVLTALERAPAMETEHLTDLLYAQGKLSKGILVSALASSKLKLPAANLKALLISQSPLDRAVLNKVSSTTNLSPQDIEEVLNAQ